MVRPFAQFFVLVLVFSCCPFINTIENYFGTKKTYPLEKEDIHMPPCQVIHTTVIARHGTRMPVPTSTKKLEATHDYIIKNFKTNYKTSPYNWIKDKIYSERLYGQGELINRGREELFGLGERISKNLPDYYKQSHKHDHRFESTCRQRTIDSAKYFYQGFFGYGYQNTPFEPFYKPCEMDTKLRFYNNVCAYKSIVKSNHDHTSCLSFRQKHYPTISKKIYRKINVNIPIDLLENVFQLCMFERNLYDTMDHWCSLFDEDDFSIFELSKDMSLYWSRGYGNHLNSMMVCELLDDIVFGFRKGIHGTELSNLKFAHDYTILPLLTTFGLYKDDFSLFLNNPKDRRWKMSNISPFSNNIIIFLTYCSEKSSYELWFYHNEKQIKIPACKNQWCTIEEFETLFWKYPYCVAR